jgi:hypothetical protein
MKLWEALTSQKFIDRCFMRILKLKNKRSIMKSKKKEKDKSNNYIKKFLGSRKNIFIIIIEE